MAVKVATTTAVCVSLGTGSSLVSVGGSVNVASRVGVSDGAVGMITSGPFDVNRHDNAISIARALSSPTIEDAKVAIERSLTDLDADISDPYQHGMASGMNRALVTLDYLAPTPGPDLTQNTTPFGLLPKETREAITALPSGAVQIWVAAGEWGLVKDPIWLAQEVYRQNPDWHREILKITKGRGVDLVIDNVGAATFTKSLAAASRGGRIVTVGNTSGYQIEFDNRLLFTKQLAVIGSTMGSRQDFIDAIEFLWQQNIKPAIDRVVPLSEGIEAIKHLEEGKQFGKIVIKP